MSNEVSVVETPNFDQKPLASEIMQVVGGEFSQETVAAAKSLINDTAPTSVVEISPDVAAWIYINANEHNRGLSVAKALAYRDAMADGEWKLNHQGIAFYKDNTLADGQHRCAGIALCGRSITTTVFRNFDDDAIDTIDLGKGRTAGDALEMKGVTDGKVKAGIAKTVEEYIHQAEWGKKPTLTVQKIEKAVQAHDDALAKAIEIGQTSTENVSAPCLTPKEAATIAYLLYRGGVSGELISGYIASIQQGVATYPQSPTIDLANQFQRARHASNTKHRMNLTMKIALMVKGFDYWVNNESVARMKFSKKESLPLPRGKGESEAA